METLVCFLCKESKPLDCFSPSKRNTNRYFKSSYCKPCFNAKYRSSKEASNARYHRTKDNKNNKIAALLNACKGKRKELTKDYIIERLESNNWCCEISGVPFEFKTKSPYMLSIDRVDCTKGYTKDNIRLVCWWLNAAMGTWGLEFLLNNIKGILDNDKESFQNSTI